MSASGSKFWLVVYGPDAAPVGEASLDCEDSQEAVIMAFSTASPYGHDLLSGNGFLGRFEAALSMADDLDWLA